VRLKNRYEKESDGLNSDLDDVFSNSASAKKIKEMRSEVIIIFLSLSPTKWMQAGVATPFTSLKVSGPNCPGGQTPLKSG